ncbi:unnamed protein product [Blepharisma stoltei]|uniref:Uncharacterized protein n=1 Tax=Blepharisma stoltei TaxID=1481888 RepID=A0AAU9JNC4_9CILI|nr:unnamed protein product [Blepharisma stoltei]
MLRQTKRFSVLRARQPEEENGLLGWLEGLLGNKKEQKEGEHEKEEKEAKKDNESEEEKKKSDEEDNSDEDGDGGIMIPIPRGLAGLFYFKTMKKPDRIFLPLQHQWQDPRLCSLRGIKASGFNKFKF